MLRSLLVALKCYATEPTMQRLIPNLNRQRMSPRILQLRQARRLLPRADLVHLRDVLEKVIFASKGSFREWLFLAGEVVVVS